MKTNVTSVMDPTARSKVGSTEETRSADPNHPCRDEALRKTGAGNDVVTRNQSPDVTLVQVIEPSNGWVGFDWRELWRYRELLYFLAWRDVKVRYKQTALGGAWAILQPLLTMVVFTLLFGRLAGFGDKTGEIPYAAHVYAGLLPWTFFANSLTNLGGSLVGNAQLVTKIYFPRLLVPLGAMGSGFVDLVVSLTVLVPLMLYYGIKPSLELLTLPVAFLGIVLVTAGIGCWLAALTVAYRDFKYVVPFTLQIWMFLTPIIYPSSMVPEKWRWLVALNPMAGLIDGFRDGLLGTRVDWSGLSISLCVSAIVLVSGVSYFRQVERRLADII